MVNNKQIQKYSLFPELEVSSNFFNSELALFKLKCVSTKLSSIKANFFFSNYLVYYHENEAHLTLFLLIPAFAL